jgi:hypothetical protein
MWVKMGKVMAMIIIFPIEVEFECVRLSLKIDQFFSNKHNFSIIPSEV